MMRGVWWKAYDDGHILPGHPAGLIDRDGYRFSQPEATIHLIERRDLGLWHGLQENLGCSQRSGTLTNQPIE